LHSTATAAWKQRPQRPQTTEDLCVRPPSNSLTPPLTHCFGLKPLTPASVTTTTAVVINNRAE